MATDAHVGLLLKQSRLAPNGQEYPHVRRPCTKTRRWGITDPRTEAGTFLQFQQNDVRNIIGQYAHLPNLWPEDPCGDARAHGGIDRKGSIFCGAQFNIKVQIERDPSPCARNLQHGHFVKKHLHCAWRLAHEDVGRQCCGDPVGLGHRKS